MRNFSKHDDRLSHNQNSRKIVKTRATFAVISSQIRTQSSTSAKVLNEIENEKGQNLVQRLRERQNRTELDNILDEIKQKYGSDREYSQNQLAKQLHGICTRNEKLTKYTSKNQHRE
jgi:Fic family protein